MTRGIHVHTPSRLHFGMFSFGHTDRLQYGGVGIMVEPPAVDVTLKPADVFSITGDISDRVASVVDRLADTWDLGKRPACEIRVNAPRNHSGLGVGTQLTLATAVGLQHFLSREPMEILDLANLLGRAKRSSVGTLGFERGGLIADYGKLPGEPCAMFLHQSLPEEWRFVLIASRDQQGLMGEVETKAFATLPPVPEEVTERLIRICNDELSNPMTWKNFDDFGEALYTFGRLAGECFAPVQGGPYANAQVASLVGTIRNYGVRGVGQSSWGPTVFAVTATETEALEFVAWFNQQFNGDLYDTTIAKVNNTGVQVKTLS